MITRRTLLTSALATSGLAGLGGLAGCGQTTSPTTPSPTGPTPRPAVGRFAARMLGELAEPGKNHVHSPLSILLALGLLRSGASGRVAEQLDQVIASSGLDDWEAWAHQSVTTLRSRSGTFKQQDVTQRVTVAVAAAVFAALGLEVHKEYATRVAKVHDATIDQVDFTRPEEAAGKINRWAAEHTDNQITQIIDPGMLSPATVIVLTNALHLAAHWAREFTIDPQLTTPFRRDDGSSVQVAMMHTRTYGWYTDQHVQAGLLPFAGDKLAMAVALPKSDWNQTIAAWSDGALDAMLAGFDLQQPVAVHLPPWTMDWYHSVNDALKRLGLDAIFHPGDDLSGIADAGIQVDQVLHRAVVAVDQYGVVASAVTAITGVTSAPVEVRELTLDQPFGFVIFDVDSRLPLFIGRLADPQ